MKKILGLDIGTTSIGWALVNASEEKPKNNSTLYSDKERETVSDINNQRIGIHIGNDGLPAVNVRIIQQDDQRFRQGLTLNDSKGQTLTPTATRRKFRGSRRIKSRYKLRRDKLCAVLKILGMLPEGSFEFDENKKRWNPIENSNGNWYNKTKGKTGEHIGKKLYGLRANAIKEDEKITLAEWGRILLHLNQWRGYSSDRFKNEEETKATKKGDKEIFTSLVISVEGPINHDNKYHRFKITFEDGNSGWQIRKKENSESEFKANNELFSYYYEKDSEEIEGIKKIKKAEEVDKTSWAYRKKEINDAIESFVKNENGTVGSYFYYKHFIANGNEKIARIRANVINREWYEEEFDGIWKNQFKKHKEHFTSELIDKCIDAAFADKNLKKSSIRNEIRNLKINGVPATDEEKLKYLIKDKIIYYQRPWQQAKNKGECRFEKILKRDKQGNIIYKEDKKIGNKYPHIVGRTVIPRSHPLHQEFKIWQQINNVRLWYHCPNGKFELFTQKELFNQHSPLSLDIADVKSKLYDCLQGNKSKSWSSFVNKELGLPNVLIDEEKKRRKGKNSEAVLEKYYTVNFIKKTRKGDIQDNPLKGNTTKVSIKNVLSEFFKEKNLLKTLTNDDGKETILEDKTNEWFDKKHTVSNHQVISNLQLLWELIYDITESKTEKVAQNIIKDKNGKKHFPELVKYADALAKIKFDDKGMGQLSAKAIRNLLPLMAESNYRDKYPLTDKVQKQIEKLVELNQQEQNETDDDLKLYSLREFISDKNARIKLSSKMSTDEFSGLNYWEAVAVAYGNHSKAGITAVPKEEAKIRIAMLLPVRKGEMNNPVVEKIVNETIKLVRDISKKYDGFDEVRIELSRELKASMEERQQMWEAMQKNNKRNEWAKNMLRDMLKDSVHQNSDLSASGNNIDKIKIIEDVVSNLNRDAYTEKRKEYKLNEPTKAEIRKYLHWLEQEFKCPYTNQPIPFTDVFSRNKVVQIEHIIPRERYFDNSYSNKVITWETINQAKGNKTAYEFIVSRRGQDKFKINSKDIELVPSEKWQERVEQMFPKGRKRANLLRKELPEDPINRQLKETQYINKKLREKIGEAIGIDKVWTTTGQITDMLRNEWHLDKVMKELVRERFEKFEIGMGSGKYPIPEKINYKITRENPNTKKEEEIEIFPLKTGESLKRLDHRHHALDALIIACTKQQHIQYINTLSAQYEFKEAKDEDEKIKNEKTKYKVLQNAIYEIKQENGKNKKMFFTPWTEKNFISDVKSSLQKVIVSHKNTKLLLSGSRNKANNHNSFSLRGELHQATLIGKRKISKTIYFNQAINDIFKLKEEYLKESKIEKSYKELSNELGINESDANEIISIIAMIQSKVKKESSLKNKVLEYYNKNRNELIPEIRINQIIPVKRDTEKGRVENLTKTTNIIDERSKRCIEYRKNWIAETVDLKKKYENNEKEKKKWEDKYDAAKDYSAYPILYNAIYDVRLDKNNWCPLWKLTPKLFEKINYRKNKRTIQVKKELKKILSENNNDFFKAFEREKVLITNPIIIGENKIPLIKPTLKNKTDAALYELKKGENGNKSTWVELGNNFRAYIFENKKGERDWQVLSFKEAVDLKIKSFKEGKYVNSENLFLAEKIKDGFELTFTLTHRDTVFINPKKNGEYEKLSIEMLKNLFDWKISQTNSSNQVDEKIKTVISNLWIVNRFSISPTGSSMNFVKINSAKEISVALTDLNIDKIESEDVKNKLLKMIQDKKEDDESKKKIPVLEETITPYNKELLANCIKIYVDKLGKSVVPYWDYKK